MKNRRDELQKGVRLHAEHWFWDEYPRFEKGDLVWSSGDKDTCMTVIEHQEHGILLTDKGAFTTIQIQYFVLQPEPEVINLRKVDFQLLKIAINQLENGNLPNDPQRDNLMLFFKCLGQSGSFAHLAHVQFKNQ